MQEIDKKEVIIFFFFCLLNNLIKEQFTILKNFVIGPSKKYIKIGTQIHYQFCDFLIENFKNMYSS